MTTNLKATYPETTCFEGGRSKADFLCLLFHLLEENGVRYCVLHSWEALPGDLASDLDLALHPDDLKEVPYVFHALSSRGYHPLQGVKYALNGYRFDFIWFDTTTTVCVAVDITHAYVEGGLFLISGETLVNRRQRWGNFWIADPAVEFRYLLARTISKGTLADRHARRLTCLAKVVDRHIAECIAEDLFGRRHGVQVIKACIHGRLAELVPALKIHLWSTTLKRDPLNPIRYMLANSLRLIRRWLEPTGILIVFLGPDGVGKSALINSLAQEMCAAFRRHRIFHYRPMLVFRRKGNSAVTDPHGKAPHAAWWSLGQLLAQLADYWLGYLLIIRPLLARSGLVIFDRYFYDLPIDPRRYRYGGPLWLARLLCALMPKPDLVFVMDAPTRVILSRKQEVAPEEVERQREGYLREARKLPRARVIDSSRPFIETHAEVARIVADHLDHRFQRKSARWLALRRQSQQSHSFGDAPNV